MTHKINTDKTAAVSTEIYWLPIDDDTPVAVRMLLYDKDQGIAHCRTHSKHDGFSHWYPLPKVRKDMN